MTHHSVIRKRIAELQLELENAAAGENEMTLLGLWVGGVASQ
jgi:hypothetical protein